MAKVAESSRCRQILSLMIMVGFMIHHMLRVNIAIAIVEMIARNNNSNNTLETHGSRFSWDEQQKNDILGCFFWGYVVLQIPGGRLSEIFGTRIVLGISMFTASLFTILTPAACYFHYYFVILARVCLGLVLGVQWSSVPPMAARWVAPTDTSKFMSHTMASSLGVAITLPICGYIIEYLGWPSVFYVTGTIALVWSITWFYLVYDSPGQHPRISEEEKDKLENEIKCEINKIDKRKVPWKKVLISGPVWAIIVANTVSTYNVFIILNHLPSYMDEVLHFNIKQNGILSSLPYLGRYLIAIASCYMADKLRKSEKFSTTAIRKFFNTTAFCGSGLCFSIEAIWGYKRITSVTVFIACLGFNGLTSAGFLPNSLDISPVYSGTIYGISNLSVSVFGYVSTKMVALITKEKQDFGQWRYIFWILVGINVIGSIIYLVYASGELQSWNPKNNEVEMKKLRDTRNKFCDTRDVCTSIQ